MPIFIILKSNYFYRFAVFSKIRYHMKHQTSASSASSASVTSLAFKDMQVICDFLLTHTV